MQELKAEKTRESGKTAEDFWKPAIKVMCDSKLADTLNAVDPNDVPVRTLRLLEEKIFHREDADAAKIRNFSVAAEGEKCADWPRPSAAPPRRTASPRGHHAPLSSLEIRTARPAASAPPTPSDRYGAAA